MKRAMEKKYTKKNKKKNKTEQNGNRKMYKAASERGLGLSKDLRCKFSCNKTKVVQFSCVTDSRRRSVMRSGPVSAENWKRKSKGNWTAQEKKKVAMSELPFPSDPLDKSLTCVALEIITNKNLENLAK